MAKFSTLPATPPLRHFGAVRPRELKLGFTEADRERMHQLAVKNQGADLTKAEQRELDSYRRVGRLLDLLSTSPPLPCQARPQHLTHARSRAETLRNPEPQ